MSETVDWYRFNLKRSQRNVGAIVALELAIEAAAFYAGDRREWRYIEYVRKYTAAMRDACNGRPGTASAEHSHWVRVRDPVIQADAIRAFEGPMYIPDRTEGHNMAGLGRVLQSCRLFFVTYNGNAYGDGWEAVRRMMRLAVQADLVDTEHQAFALWWHTLRCRLAFHDSSHCVFV